MFEQDYIMRLIKEMVRVILKLVFHIDTDSPSSELLKEKDAKNVLDNLLELVDSGNINEAENKLFEITKDSNMQNLEISLLFYSHLNDKSNDFLEEHGFSREEVKQGIQDLTSKYGIDSMIEAFLD